MVIIQKCQACLMLNEYIWIWKRFIFNVLGFFRFFFYYIVRLKMSKIWNKMCLRKKFIKSENLCYFVFGKSNIKKLTNSYFTSWSNLRGMIVINYSSVTSFLESVKVLLQCLAHQIDPKLWLSIVDARLIAEVDW